MTNNLTYPEFKMPTQKEIEGLQIVFDANNFKEKLSFWNLQNWDWRLVALSSISIKPKNNEEIEILYQWRVEHIIELSANFEAQLEKKFFYDTTTSKRPKEYAERRLSEINSRTNLGMSFDEEDRFFCHGYNGAIDSDHSYLKKESEDFKAIAFQYADGVAFAEYKNFLDEQLKELTINPKSYKKLKWRGTPSQFGWLFLELANKGHIEFPLHNGEINYAGLAKISFELFEIETTKENFIKEMNPNKNTLSDTKRGKFTIPELKDIC